jgi:hypothetical protein
MCSDVFTLRMRSRSVVLTVKVAESVDSGGTGADGGGKCLGSGASKPQAERASRTTA